MPITEPVIRPPAEAGSLFIQVTTGCSADTCTFCGAYKSKRFGIKEPAEINGDIDEGAALFPETRRIFLMDGDALAAPDRVLLPLLDRMNSRFPKLTRISSYANGFNITRRGPEELSELAKRKLRLIYMGLESGSEEVLRRHKKRATVEEMVRAVRLAERASIRSSVIVLLGLGGKEMSGAHALETARALNLMQPAYLSFLSVMLIPGTPLYEEARNGDFLELETEALLKEARDIIKGLELRRTVFRSDHASNHLPLQGRFPKDKERLMDLLHRAISGDLPLRPDFLRGL